MTGLLIDTGPLSAYFLGRQGAGEVIDRLMENAPAQTSVLCYGEVVEYLSGMPSGQQRTMELRQLLLRIRPIGLPYRVLERYALIRRELRSNRVGLIGDVDTLIAATAITHQLTLVTTDRDLLRVPGLDRILLAPKTFEILEPSMR